MERGKTSSRKTLIIKSVAIFVIVTGLVVGTVAYANYWLTPLSYSHDAQNEAAVAWASGQNIAISDANVDFRELRREHIKQMRETPDVVILGGSRWQEASSEALPGKRMYNAFVSNDHFEDMLAITELLYANNRLPKTLVLSARFSTFEYLERREAWWWKSWAPEYRTISKRLGLPTYSTWETLQPEKAFRLISLDMLMERVDLYRNNPARWKVTTATSDPTMDVVGADGALHFSDAHLNMYTQAYAEDDARHRAAKERNRELKINPPLLDHLEKLVVFLKDKGVRVVFLQTPFHPTFYREIQGGAYYNSMMKIEDAVRRVADKHGVFAGGGFDATTQGCDASDYRDFNHSSVRCLRKILAQMPSV